MDQNFQEWIEIVLSSLSNPTKFKKLETELKDQIISIQKTDYLTEKFKNDTNEFIDKYSPKIITEILNLTPSEQEYVQNLNSILESYIILIPKFLFTDHFKFSKSVQKIVTEKDYPFYYSTISNSYSFLSTSPLYSSNLKIFLNSDILNKSKTHFESQGVKISFDIYYNVIYLINVFHSQWDKKSFKSFFTTFSTSFIQAIKNVEKQDFRNISENQINSIYNILFEMKEQDQSLIQNLKDSQIDFCLRMLNSTFLSKQFCAINTFRSMENLPDRVFQKIKDENTLDNLFENLHDELFTGYAWLLKKMIVNGYIESSYLLNLWDITLTKYSFYIDKWSTILNDLTPEVEELFWQKIAKTRSFPLPVYSLLRKISIRANESQKKMIFQCLFQQVFSSDITDETEDEVIQTVVLFIPRDEEFKLSVKDQCIDLIKSNLHVSFALNVLKKLVFYFGAQDSRDLFHTFLKISPDISFYTQQYLDFLVSDMRHFVTPLNDEESEEFSSLARKLVPSKSKELQKFFEDIAKTQKIIFPTLFFENIIIRLSQMATESKLNFFNDDNCVDLLICLFKEVNHKSFESIVLFNDLWIQSVTNLTCEDEIWNILYQTSNLKLASFLSRLYSNCKESRSLEILTKHCLVNPPNYGALKALLQSIDQREGIIVKKDKVNKWTKLDDLLNTFYFNSNSFAKTVEIKITGDFSSTLSLPPVIKAQVLKSRISDLLLVRRDSFNLQLNGESLPSEVVHFTKASLLKITISEKERFAPTKPTDFLGQEENQFIVSLLSSSDEEISKVALEIANNLPTNEQEKNLLTSSDKINWESVFDSSHINLLLYRLNAIGNLLQTDWQSRFHDENGAFFLYDLLVVKNHLYRSNPIILLLLQKMIESEKPIFKSFGSNDYETLIKLIFTEDEELSNESNAIILMNILKNESKEDPSVLFSLPLFNELVSKSIFHPNKTYRATICSIISLKTDKKDFLLQFLDSSDCDYCQEFYHLFERSIENETDDSTLFHLLSNLIISHFYDTEDIQKILFIKSPNEPFVNGILSLLHTVLSTTKNENNSNEDIQKLIKFMLQCVAFNPIYYYPLKPFFFSLLKILMKSSSLNEQFLFEKLSEIHDKTNLPKLIQNIQFSASHEGRKGLRNLGSTCYANSVLQQLFNVIQFRNSFLSNSCEEKDWEFQLQMIFAKLLFFPSTFVSTENFFKVWKGWDGKPLKTYEQQDAVEFLQLILDRVNEKFPHVADIFKGKIQHDTVGVNVEYENVTDEDFTTLGLDVNDQKDIDESLSKFLLPDFHNDYNADELGRINAKRFHRILKAPSVLIIQLKRFSYDLQQQQRLKITKRYIFPHVFDITRAMVDQTNRVEYELIGVVVHIGNANTGHYFSYCKDLSVTNNKNNNKYGKWFCCNDTRVRQFDGSLLPEIASGENANGNMNDDTAYILFYKKKNDNDTQNQEDNKNISENVISKIANEIQESLRSSVLTSISYAKFIYEICDENDPNKGQFTFNYFVKFLRILPNEQIINDFVTKCNKYIEMSKEFSNFVVSQTDIHLLMLLQNECLITREKYSKVLCNAMDYADSYEVQNLINFLISKLESSVEYWRNFDDFFLPFLKCVSINSCSNINLLPIIFDFLQKQVPEYVKEHSDDKKIYQRIKLNYVFKLLVVLLSSSALKNEYKSIIFSNSFLDRWIQSQYHAVAFAQLLRSFVLESPELSTVYFKFLVENANDLSPESAASHFSVLSNSQNKSNEDQINWCFNFLRTKPPVYIKIFLEQLTMKMKESKIDFSFPFLKYGDIWINEWLFSSDSDLRKSVRQFIATVFQSTATKSDTTENSNVNLHELLNLLISKIPEMTQITTKRKKNYKPSSSSTSVEYSLPANTFYSLLSWVVINGKFELELTEIASQLTDALISHKALQLKDNFPQQRLVEVICLCKSSRFFEIVSPKKFLSAFSNVDCSVESNKTMSFNAIKFIPNGHFFDVVKSEIFIKLASFELTENYSNTHQHFYYRTTSKKNEPNPNLSVNNESQSSSFMNCSVFNSIVFPISMPLNLSVSLTNFENIKFMEYVFSQINPHTAQDIASALWQRNFHKALIDSLFATISKQILTVAPETAIIFVKQRCHFSIVDQIKSQIKIFLSTNENGDDKVKDDKSSAYYLTIYFQLLQAFTDAYKEAFLGKKTWYGSCKFYPIVRFWDKYKALIGDIIKLLMKSNNLEEIDAAASLLRCVAMIDDNLAAFIFDQIASLNGKMLVSMNVKFRNSVFLLIDSVSNLLINNTLKQSQLFCILEAEFNSLVESKMFDLMILDSLNRRIDMIIDFSDPVKLKKTDIFLRNYEIWQKIN
ncbi:Ubiquitin carboxyl-terminal hydrolase 34 [Tritrichomonas musculus]|uniref:Ubiquitin carboxyl-terminal hydrolase 34 n=1 Tax=Tritrichomonas musculus TaxID=1915356 RepID=A0ABR2HI35_9EUKA